MTTILPPIPHFIFAVFEPLSLLAGSLHAQLHPAVFSATQIPSITSTSSITTRLTPAQRIITYQLGNLYLLLSLIGVAVLYTTTQRRVVRAYLLALALGDVGHLYATVRELGWFVTADVTAWNTMAVGNLGVTALLFISRLAYLAGVLGEDRIPLEDRLGEKGKRM